MRVDGGACHVEMLAVTIRGDAPILGELAESSVALEEPHSLLGCKAGTWSYPAGRGLRQRSHAHAAAHSSESRAACSSTVSVAFSCLSGG
jgi:hypothetical protein